MTVKRYMLDEGLIYDNGKEMEDVVDVLNEYAEENEHLKKELDKVKLVNEMLSMDFANSEHELWKENEQLKKDREELFIRERDTRNEWREVTEENEMLKQQLQSILELTKKIEDCTHDVKLIGDLE